MSNPQEPVNPLSEAASAPNGEQNQSADAGQYTEGGQPAAPHPGQLTDAGYGLQRTIYDPHIDQGQYAGSGHRQPTDAGYESQQTVYYPHTDQGQYAGSGHRQPTDAGYEPQQTVYAPHIDRGQYAANAGHSGTGQGQPTDRGYQTAHQPPQGNLYGQQETSNHQKPPKSAPIIDPVESARMTPLIMVYLVLSGLKRNWKWALPISICLSLFAAGAVYLIMPVQYEAKAWIRIMAKKPRFIFDNRDTEGGTYDQFVSTQISLIRSPVILEKALENADVAKLACVTKEKDKYTWLTKKLSLRLDGKSEMLIVSIECKLPDESEKIVNAVVDAYFDYYNYMNQESDQNLIRQLTGELARQSAVARQLQTSIQEKMEQAAAQGAAAGREGMAAGIGSGESLLRDAALAETRLVALRAEKKMLEEAINNPSQIPRSIIAQAVQNDPELQKINMDLDTLKAQRDKLSITLSRPDDPKLKTLDSQIAELEKRLKEVVGGTAASRGLNIQNAISASFEQKTWELSMQIRAQELQVQELNNKYKDQLTRAGSTAVNIVSTSFDQEQLKRVNAVLDTLSNRLTTLKAEMYAPEQIVLQRRATTPGAPNTVKQLMMIGVGSMAAFCFPLLLSIAIERMKPRLYHVSQVRRAMPSVLIGEIMEPPVSWVHGTSFRKRMARYRESVHNWCVHLLLSESFRRCKTLSIASVAGDDGKTFLAVQVAVAMAQMKGGDVLLIDADMRVGRLHLLFGNEETGIGLADVLSFRHGFGEAVVQNEKEPNLHLLSAGQLDVAPYELLGDGRFRELLDMLEQHYSLVLIVLPPIANASEALIMASSTDSTLLCVRQGETVLAAMEDVIRKMTNTGASVDGIVVKDIPYYQMAGKDGGFADKLEQVRLAHLLQYAD